MGQRPPYATVLKILGAFAKKKRWTQAELARDAEVSVEVVSKHLRQMRDDGWKLQDEKDPPHIVWRAAPDFFPGVLSLGTEEIPDLLRIVARAPKSPARDRLAAVIMKRLPLMQAAGAFDEVVHPPSWSDDEARFVDILEDAARKKIAIRMHYVTASRRDDGKRHVSVHDVEHGDKPRFVATCHTSGKLKWFRVAGISDARLDRAVEFRDAKRAAVEQFKRETVGGFRADGAPVNCSFVVKPRDAGWVKRVLWKEMTPEPVADGAMRVSIVTPAVHHVARFVVQLGGSALPETPELAKEVAAIAREALANAAPPAG